MTTLSSLIKNRIHDQLKKTCRVFDAELPDYILLLLTNRKSKSEVLKELCEFISREKAEEFTEWLYEEIESIKQERRVQKTPPKKETAPKKEIPEQKEEIPKEKKEIPKVKKEKSKKKVDGKSKKPKNAPIAILSSNSEGEIEPPPLIKGRRERVQSRDESDKVTRGRSRRPSSSSSSGSSVSSHSSRSPKRKRGKRKRDVKKRDVKRRFTSSESEAENPPQIVIRRRSTSAERRLILKTTPVRLLPMPDKNPFSASSGSDDRINDKSEDDILIVEPSKQTVQMNNGLINLESKMKLELEKKRNGRQEQSSKNMELIRKLEEKLVTNAPEMDDFGPPLPPPAAIEPSSPVALTDLRRRVVISRAGDTEKGTDSPVPTDSDGVSEKSASEKSADKTAKVNSKTEPTLLTDTTPAIAKKEPDVKAKDVSTRKIRAMKRPLPDAKKTDANATSTTARDEVLKEMRNKINSKPEIAEENLQRHLKDVMEDFRNPNQNGWTKIHQLAITGHLYKLRKMLCSSDLELIDKKGRSVLHESAQGGYLYQISNLIQKKMLSLQDHAGITPLHECAERAELYQLSNIDFRGLDLDLVDKRGRTVLHICAANNDTVGLKRLLASGAKKDIKDINGNLPHELASDRSVVVELGGNPEELSINRSLPPPYRSSFHEKSSKDFVPKGAKVIRLNPKKIPVPPSQLPITAIITGPDTITGPANDDKADPSSISTDPLLVPLDALTKAPIESDKVEKLSNALSLPQDKKMALDSRSDDSGSDSDRGKFKRGRKW